MQSNAIRRASAGIATIWRCGWHDRGFGRADQGERSQARQPADPRSAPLGNPQVDDPLDDLGELVGKMGGRVLVLPAERMPAQTGLAATYRY